MSRCYKAKGRARRSHDPQPLPAEAPHNDRIECGPYGYTLATWTTGAVLTNARGLPNTLAALTFMVGAVLGFAFVGTLAFGSVAKHFDRDRGETPLIWGSFHFFSVGLAIVVSALVAYYVENLVA